MKLFEDDCTAMSGVNTLPSSLASAWTWISFGRALGDDRML